MRNYNGFCGIKTLFGEKSPWGDSLKSIYKSNKTDYKIAHHLIDSAIIIDLTHNSSQLKP